MGLLGGDVGVSLVQSTVEQYRINRSKNSLGEYKGCARGLYTKGMEL